MFLRHVHLVISVLHVLVHMIPDKYTSSFLLDIAIGQSYFKIIWIDNIICDVDYQISCENYLISYTSLFLPYVVCQLKFHTGSIMHVAIYYHEQYACPFDPQNSISGRLFSKLVRFCSLCPAARPSNEEENYMHTVCTEPGCILCMHLISSGNEISPSACPYTS